MSSVSLSQTPRTPLELEREARLLFAAMHEHSALAKSHHTKARNAKRKFHQFKRELEALGVQVIIEDTQPPRRQSGTADQEHSPL